MIRHYQQFYEIVTKMRYPAYSEKFKKVIRNGVSIMDETGGSMSRMKKKFYGLLKLAARVGSNYLPEIMGNSKF
jgi:hypothetical protein